MTQREGEGARAALDRGTPATRRDLLYNAVVSDVGLGVASETNTTRCMIPACKARFCVPAFMHQPCSMAAGGGRHPPPVLLLW